MTTQSKLAVFAVALASIVLAVGNPSHVVYAASESTPGRVTQVILYRGQALVARAIPIEGPKGAMEIVVGDLPEQVVPESLFAEGAEPVEVRAVRYRTRAVGEEPREEVRKLDEALKEVQQKLELNRKGQSLLGKQNGYLDQLEGFVAPTAKSDLARGVLDAVALKQATLFSFEQRQNIADKLAALDKEAKDLGDQVTLLQRRRAELTSGASRTVREAMLFVEKRAEGKGSVRLNYLVGNCGWSPTYAFRAAADRQQVRVECNGLIHQMTGEDWNGVQLTLSTASPALSAFSPGLSPFTVTLSSGPQPKTLSPKELSDQLEAIRQRRGEAVAQIRSAATLSEKLGSNWALNAAANEFQNLEILTGKDLVSSLRAGDAEVSEGPSLSYSLAAPVSLASRSDQQMVQIFQTAFASRFYHVATPALSGHVYREAELLNTSDQDLLAGPIAAYLEGRFVGRGEIPTIARGQMFVPGFGVDPQLRARRELADKTETVQGGNRVMTFKYRIILENYKQEPVLVRLYDRLPHSEDPGAIRVALAELKTPLDEDVLYLRRDRPKGILRWQINVPVGAVREKAQIIEYGFSVEFDRNFQLATVSEKQGEREFELLQRRRVAPAPAEKAPEPPRPAPAPERPSAPEPPRSAPEPPTSAPEPPAPTQPAP